MFGLLRIIIGEYSGRRIGWIDMVQQWILDFKGPVGFDGERMIQALLQEPTALAGLQILEHYLREWMDKGCPMKVLVVVAGVAGRKGKSGGGAAGNR